MTFKEAYKTCNDEITGNRDVLAAVLNGKARRRSYTEIRAVALCASVMIVFTVAAFLFFNADNGGNFNENALYIASDDRNHTSEESTPGETYDEKTGDDMTDFPDDDERIQNNEISVNQNKPGKSNGASEDSVKKKNNNTGLTAGHSGQNDTGDNTHTRISDDENIRNYPEQTRINNDITSGETESEVPLVPESNAVSEPAEVSDDNEISTLSEDNETAIYEAPAPKASGGGGSGGGSPNSGRRDYQAGISEEEYYKYIGIDMRKSDLPDDMSFDENKRIIYEKDGDYVIHDSMSMSASSSVDSERRIDVTISKTNQFASGSEAVISQNEGSVNAIVNIDGVSVRVDSNKVNNDEIDAFIGSLKN